MSDLPIIIAIVAAYAVIGAIAEGFVAGYEDTGLPGLVASLWPALLLAWLGWHVLRLPYRLGQEVARARRRRQEARDTKPSTF